MFYAHGLYLPKRLLHPFPVLLPHSGPQLKISLKKLVIIKIIPQRRFVIPEAVLHLNPVHKKSDKSIRKMLA